MMRSVLFINHRSYGMFPPEAHEAGLADIVICQPTGEILKDRYGDANHILAGIRQQGVQQAIYEGRNN